MPDFSVDPNIRRARSLPRTFYTDAGVYARSLERVFGRGWHWLADTGEFSPGASCLPRVLLPGSLDEPLVLTRDGSGTVRALSNVCTHRGNLVAERAGTVSELRCRYHGRRFGLDGSFRSMPEFDDALDFPGPSDDLPALAAGRLGPMVFASPDPEEPFDAWIAPVAERLPRIDPHALVFDPRTSRDYVVEAHWALYCDNYLEGFHIPFVHPALNRELEYRGYRTELLPGGVLQIGEAAGGGPVFHLPEGHPDHGRSIGAYYLWLFPGTMLNLYPWGISLNVLHPLGPGRTCVVFRSYVGDASLREGGAGAGLHEVEREDEAVVEAVQRGVCSRVYRGGRFSPSRERGVHHFHRMLAARL